MREIKTMFGFMNEYHCHLDNELFEYACDREFAFPENTESLEDVLCNGGNFKYNGYDREFMVSSDFEHFFLIDEAGCNYLTENTDETVFHFNETDLYFWQPELDGIYTILTPGEYPLIPINYRDKFEWDINYVDRLDDIYNYLNMNDIYFETDITESEDGTKDVLINMDSWLDYKVTVDKCEKVIDVDYIF